MARIDWSVLERATRLAADPASPSPPPAARPATPAVSPRSPPRPLPSARITNAAARPGRAEDRRHPQPRLRHQPDPHPRPGQGQPRDRRRRAGLPTSSPASSSSTTELGLVPDLAENWTVSEDGLDYTFTLRDGLTFHNGDPLDADDIVYTYERTIDPDFASPHANKLALITSVDTPGRPDRQLHAQRALRALPGRRLQPRPRPRPDADLAARLRGDGRRAVRPDPGRLRPLRPRRRDAPT